MTDEERFKIRNEYCESSCYKFEPHGYTDWLENQLHTVRSAMEQVDDVLNVNWVAVRNNNYRQALFALQTSAIALEDYYREQEPYIDTSDYSDSF